MADEKPTPSIRDRLTEAWDDAEREAADAPEEVDRSPPQRRDSRPPAEEADRDELAEGIERRPEDLPRDPQGRFLPRGEEPPEQPEPEKQPAKAPEPQPRPEGEEPRPEGEEAPKEPANREAKLARMTANWNAQDKEFLSKQAEPVQDFLIDRVSEMDKAWTRKTQNLSAFVNEYGPVHQMLEPELPAIRAAGYTPRLLIEGWANCERALLQGPEQAAMTLRSIAEGYKVPRETIAHFFGFDPRTPEQIGAQAGTPAPATNGAAPPLPQEFRDPRVDYMLAERQEQQERETIAYNQRLRQAANTAMTLINQFREARDNRGNLLHPYFAEVEDYMTMLAEHHGKTTGKVPPLNELYDSAVNANTAVRTRMLAATQAAQSERQRATQAARGKADLARRASSSVVGSGRPTNRTLDRQLPRGSSVRAHIDAALDAAGEE